MPKEKATLVVPVTDKNFKKEVLQSDLPVLVDFFADWCGPCKVIAPHVEALAKKYAGELRVCKAKLDDCSKIADKYDVQSIPALMVFKDGEVMGQSIGAVPRAALEKLIKEVL